MKKFLFVFSLLITAALLRSQTSELPELVLEDFAEGFDAPIDVQHAGDSRLFIVEQPGRIWVVNPDGIKSEQPFLDITDRVLYDGGERGLLGLAFDPSYKTNGFFYVNYINLAGNTTIARFRASIADPNRAQKNSEAIVLIVE